MEKQDSKDAISTIVQILLKICAGICMALLAAIFVVTILQVFCRFVLGSPLVWCEEFCRYAGVWLVMLSTAIAIEKRSHMSLDLVTGKLGPKGQMILQIFGDLVVLCMAVYMTVGSYKMCGKFWSNPSVAMHMPMGYVYLGMVVGWICSILVGAYNVIESLKSLGKGGQA